MTEDTIKDLKALFTDRYARHHQAQYSVEIDPDDIEIVNTQGGLLFLHAGRFVDDFEYPNMEEGRVLYSKVGALVRESIDDRLRDIADRGKAKREMRKARKQLNSL